MLPPPAGFELDDMPPPPRGFKLDAPKAPATPRRRRTEAVDGDTFDTEDERVRVWGYDAPELDQPGYRRDGSTVPVGQQSRDALGGLIEQGPTVGLSQGTSYGRTVAPVTIQDADLAEQLLREGQGFAAPSFIANDPGRRFDYLQAERLARLNRLGVHDYYVQPPEEHRANPGYIPARETVAQFFDTPTPIAGMSAAAEQRYLELLDTSDSPEEIAAFVESQGGFKIDPVAVDAFIRARDAARASGANFSASDAVTYDKLPMPLTDTGDGAAGAGTRGFGQGFVAGGLDELGAFPDMFGGTPGRENIWNSDRRWADIWYNNQQQNASILGYDEFAHPTASTVGNVTGAVTSGFVIPYGQGARTVPQLARVGGVYGALEGFLGTDGGVAERALNVPASALVGAGLNAVGGKAVEFALPRLAGAFREMNAPGPSPAVRAAGYVEPRVDAPPIGDDLAPPPPEGFVVDEPTVAPVEEPVAAPAAEPLPAPVAGEPSDPFAGAIESGVNPESVQSLSSIMRAPRATHELYEPGDYLTYKGQNGEVIASDADTVTLSLPEGQKVIQRNDPELAVAPLGAWSREHAASGDTPAPASEALPAEAAPGPRRGGPRGPDDMIRFIARNGGISYDGLNKAGRKGGTLGHDLRNTGNLARFVPGAGPLLRPNGRSLDDMAELLWDTGYFGPPDVTPRPTDNELITMLDDLLRTGKKRYSSFEAHGAGPEAPRPTRDGEMLDEQGRTEAEAQADAAASDEYWNRYDRLSGAAQQRYAAVLLMDDVAELEAFMREGTDTLPAREPTPDLTDDELAPYIGGWLNRKIDEALDDAHLETDDGFYDARAFEAGPPGRSGEGRAPEPGNPRQGEAGDGTGGEAGPRDEGLEYRPEAPRTLAQDFDVPVLTERLERAVGKTVTMRIVDSLGGPAGMFTNVKGPTKGFGRLIEVARDTAPGDGTFTLDHEITHALRDMGAFTKADWSIVAARARKEKDLMASVAERYSHLGPEEQLEEAVADLFAKWQRGDYKPTTRVAAAFERIRQVFEAIRNAWRGDGFRTARGVMDDAASGRLAGVADDAPTGAVKASIPESDNYRPGIHWRVGDPLEGAAPEARTLTEAMGNEPTWRGKGAAAFDRFRTAMQDRHLPLLRTQQAIERMTGKPLPDELNAYMGEELMSGRIGAQLEKLNEDMVRPLFDDMAERRVTIGELESFLRARHAPERNARMAEINPRFADGGGSGMTDQEAATILEEFRAAGKTDDLEALAARVDAIRDYALDYRVEGGLMSRETADLWRQQYPNYVPLRGFSGEEAVPPARPNQSGGVNVRGRESQRAFGRESESDSPLAYTLLQAEEALARAETNRVAQRMIALAKENPDEAFWKINKTETRQRINEETGLVEDYSTNQLLAEDKDWTITAKIDGKEVRLTLNRDNPAARQMAQSLRRLTEHQLDLFTHYAGTLTRYESSVNTKWNPEFIVSNAFRDFQTAAINLSGLGIKGLTRRTILDYPAALAAATKGSFRKGGGEWRRWYDDFIEDGGRVYFNRIEDVGQIRKRIQKSFRLARVRSEGGTALQHIERGFMATADLVENLNSGVENAIRLATYKNARQLGMSRDKAARLAKNITVNFNRRGTMGPAVNAMYMFYNASVQGTVRTLQLARTAKGRKILAGIAAAGAASEMLNTFLSGTDDDGELFYDKIPAYEKSRNIIIMMPGGSKYMKIPSAFGYNAVWEAGRTPVEIWRRGGQGWQESAGNYLKTLVDAFNPVGGTNSLLNFVAPTFADPFVEIYQNENFAGSPIMPVENPFEPPVPDHRRFFNSTAPQWQAISGFLNEASGGNAVEPGLVSVSPETLEHLFGFVVGGAGRFATDTFDLAAKGAEGENIEVGDIPFVRRVMGEKPAWLDKSTFYDRLQEVELATEYRDEFIDRGLEDEANAFVEREGAALSLEQDAKDARRELRAIRKERRELEGAKEGGEIDQAAFDADMAQIDEREQALVLAFNTRWNAAIRGAGPASPAESPSSGDEPPPGFEIETPEGEAGGVNVYADLEDAIPGVRFTSGFRDEAYQADMRRRGYNPAGNSAHLDGSALDMLPPQGKSLSWLRSQVAKLYPDAKLLIHDGHLHAEFPGYYGAPPLEGAIDAGVRNPLAGMPAPPSGFTVD